MNEMVLQIVRSFGLFFSPYAFKADPDISIYPCDRCVFAFLTVTDRD